MSSPAQRPPLAAIFAIGENGALGRGGGLPWEWPEDRAHFERTTRGHAVLMGRRTFEETGTPLEGRVNVVVSRTMEARAGVHVARTLEEAIAIAREADAMPFVIGGAEILKAAWPQLTRVYVTTIPLAPQADVYFQVDRTGFEELATWSDARGAQYVILERR